MKKYFSAFMAVLLLSGCSAGTEPMGVNNTRFVKALEVGESMSNDSISLSGSVVPVKQASVSFKVAGVIDEVYVKEGEPVKAGQKLASLKNDDYKLQAEAAQAQTAGADAQADTAAAGISAAQAQADAAMSQIKTAQASLDAAISARDTAQLQIDTEIPSKIEQAKQQLDLTQIQYNNISKLYENGVATKIQLDEITTKLNVDKQTYQQALDAQTVAKSKLRAAQAQIDAAQSTKQAAQSAYDAANAQVNAARSATSAARAQTNAAKANAQAAGNSLSDTTIYSPMDGVVLKRVMNSGETVAAGTPIVVVGANDEMWVRVGVPDNYINDIKGGQRAAITVYGTDERLEGVVDEVGAIADSTTRTFTVNIKTDNSNNALKAGMICSAEIILADKSGIFVPIDSVISMPEPDGDSVFVLEKDTVKKAAVETGEIRGDKIEILSGVKVGDKIVVEGQFVLNDGDSVVAEVSGND